MMIKPYGDLPRIYTPDVGEVVEARRNMACKFVRAVVLHVRRRSAELLEIKVQWLESDPNGYITRDDGQLPEPAPIIEGAIGWIKDRRIEGAPLLIRQINKGADG